MHLEDGHHHPRSKETSQPPNATPNQSQFEAEQVFKAHIDTVGVIASTPKQVDSGKCIFDSLALNHC